MSAKYGMLDLLAKKLGINEEATLKKASEISRLMEMKISTSNTQLNSSGQSVVCLELAANLKGTAIDKNLAIRLSGLTKKAYTLQLYTMERLLNLQPPTSVKDVCIRLGCSELVPLSEKLLARHKEECQWTEKEHPMYAAGAIFALAKKQRISVDKKKLSEFGRTTPNQLDRVHNLMSKTLSKMGGMKKTAVKTSQSRGKVLLDILSKSNTETIDAEEDEQALKQNVTSSDDYDAWRQRMLDEADAELAGEKQEN